MHRSLLLALALAPLLTGWAQAQTYTLKRKLAKGTKVEVKENRKSTYTMVWKSKVKERGSGAETVEVRQRYQETVRSSRPELLWREYSECKQAKGRPKDLGEPLPTTLHGQRVFVSAYEIKPDGGFKIGEDDKNRMRFERILFATLPPQEVVKVRDSWTIPSGPIVGAVFGPQLAAQQKGSSAKVTLKSVKKVKGVEVATLKIKLKFVTELRQNLPGIELNLKGEYKWDVAEGLLLEGNLSGPIAYQFVTKDGRGDAEGTMNWSYKATILNRGEATDDSARTAGAPPPPGTRLLVCEHKPEEHKILLDHYPACTLCGKALDKNRACPNGDPFPFQYCPHDGARFVPE